MNESNGNRRKASIDVIEEENENASGNLYDPTNPLFQPPKQHETKKGKSWKRKLVGSLFILFLIVGGGLALYLLLRVNRVNVKVQADSRRESVDGRSPTPSNNSESGISAEAISIARQAVGPDSAPTNAKATASPTGSPENTGPATANMPRLLTFTENSPAYSSPSDSSSATSTQTNAVSSTPGSSTEVSTQASQSRANTTHTLFVEDSAPKSPTMPVPTGIPLNASNKKLTPDNETKLTTAVSPPFGTLLPVRTQGVIFSLRNNSYARLELSRDCHGDGWSLPKGTLLIGRINGSENNRAYVNTIGYIDPRTNRFVKMAGEVLGSDGGSGVPGKRVTVDRNRLKQTLSKVASSGLQMAGMMAGALTGRGTLVVNGTGLLNPLTEEAGRLAIGDDQRSFVKVEAGQSAYVMVSDLPKEVQAVDAPGEDELATSLTDREVMELILFGTSQEVRAAFPLMNDELRKLALKSIGTENDKE